MTRVKSLLLLALLVDATAAQSGGVSDTCKRSGVMFEKRSPNDEINPPRTTWTYSCVKRVMLDTPKSFLVLHDSTSLYVAVYAVLVLILLIGALFGLLKYIRDLEERRRTREIIEQHLVQMRRARYNKARARREESFQRRVLKRAQKKNGPKKKKSREVVKG